MSFPQVQSSLSSIHQVSHQMTDNSSIIRNLETKAAEILQLQEAKSQLEMELKMEKESHKMESVEFAFREQEYKREIQSLKEKVDDFEKGIVESASKANHRYYEIDVLLKSEKEKNAKLTFELDNCKRNSEILRHQLENQKLQFTQIEKKLKEKYAKLKESTYRAIAQKEQEMSDYKDKMENKTNKLQRLIQDLEQKVKAGNIEYSAKLNEKETQIRDDIQQYRNTIEDLRTENSRLTSKYFKIAKKNEEIEQKLFECQQAIQHSKYCLEHLGKTLGVDDMLIPGHEWDLIETRVLDLIQKSSELAKTTRENDVLQKRLGTAIDEMQKEKKILSKQSDITQEDKDDELIKTLQIALQQTRDELLKTQDKVANYQIKSRLSSLIDHHQVKVMKSLADLHSTIFHSDKTLFRSLIFTVILGLRIPKIIQNKTTIFDPHSLVLYQGRPEFSFVNKVKELKDKIFEKEHDVTLYRQNFEEAKCKIDDMNREKAEEEKRRLSEIGTESDHQMQILKQQITHLNKELSRHISPELYQRANAKLAKLEERNKILKSELEQTHAQLVKRINKYDEMKQNFRQYILASDHQTKLYNQMKAKYDSQISQIDGLNSLLRERTKEILALERSLNRHTIINTAALNSCACIVAENSLLSKNASEMCEFACESSNCKRLRGKEMLHSINPEFLGKGDYCCC